MNTVLKERGREMGTKEDDKYNAKEGKRNRPSKISRKGRKKGINEESNMV